MFVCAKNYNRRSSTKTETRWCMENDQRWVSRNCRGIRPQYGRIFPWDKYYAWCLCNWYRLWALSGWFSLGCKGRLFIPWGYSWSTFFTVSWYVFFKMAFAFGRKRALGGTVDKFWSIPWTLFYFSGLLNLSVCVEWITMLM